MSARLTPQQKALRSVLEADFQRQVIQIATAYGWKHYAPPKAGVRRDGSVRAVVAGWPDLALLKNGVLILAELKRETGTTTPEQDGWLAALRLVPGVIAQIWRPSDLGHIRIALSTLAALPVPTPEEAPVE